MSAAIKQIKCTKASELLETLSNQNQLWSKARRFWVFRGHSDDDNYKLIPNALRSTVELGFTHEPKKGVQSTNSLQIQAEFERLQEFFWSVDAQGLPMPIDGNLLRTPDSYNKLQANIEKQWPCDELLPLMALAQHYGISTRLLDWSDNPLTAAHFAATGHVEIQRRKSVMSNNKKLGIWTLNFDWVIHHGYPSASTRKMAVFVVTAPRASNPNLHAQGGVFTTELLDKKDQRKTSKPVIRSVDEIVESRWQQMNWPEPVMAHITLPCSEAGKLLRLLYKEGIDKSTLFPGYQGVADAIKERSYWDKRERPLYWMD